MNISNALFAGLLLTAMPLSAQQTASNENKSADYSSARSLAEQGSAVAQNNLGAMYAGGSGVAKNDTEAARWFRLAADQGFAEAQFNLGLMYNKGVGLAKNDVEAARWYQRAADQGLATAQLNLGAMYVVGTGVVKNDAVAFRLYRLAADQGLATAQYNLGVRYADGKGIAKNYIEAYKWLSIAAAGEVPMVALNARFYLDNYLEKKLTKEQLAEAQKLSSSWTKKMIFYVSPISIVQP